MKVLKLVFLASLFFFAGQAKAETSFGLGFNYSSIRGGCGYGPCGNRSVMAIGIRVGYVATPYYGYPGYGYGTHGAIGYPGYGYPGYGYPGYGYGRPVCGGGGCNRGCGARRCFKKRCGGGCGGRRTTMSLSFGLGIGFIS